MNPDSITKQNLVDLAWKIYSCPTANVNILQLILVNYSSLYKRNVTTFNENDVVKPSVFFKNLDLAVEGSSYFPSTLKSIAKRVKEIIILDLDQMPLYINDLLLKEIAIWRLKNNLVTVHLNLK